MDDINWEKGMQVTIPALIAIIGLVFLAVQQSEHRGRHIGWWGAILVGIAVVWGFLT